MGGGDAQPWLAGGQPRRIKGRRDDETRRVLYRGGWTFCASVRARVSSRKLVFAAYHGLPWFYHGRRRSVFRSVLCCSVFRFTSDRPKLRNAALVLGPGQGPPDRFESAQRITRCKTQFRSQPGQFPLLRESHTFYTWEEEKERKRVSLITPLVHKSRSCLSLRILSPSLSLLLFFLLYLFRTIFDTKSLVLSNESLKPIGGACYVK